ncbi:hypothetical protein SEA_QUARTZ_54 [Microbacterium phage Quartz]|nr:hypothetical protein SEA_MANDALORIAN_53 [Microbacterium phage Mandalorian]UVK59273.1 hypothetical protein SEA_QUARTZ_54 [Microbacterium phage Quartz]
MYNEQVNLTVKPTISVVRNHLLENDWTTEEVDQFEGYFFRNVNADGTTTLTFRQWEEAIYAYSNEHFDLD